MRFSACMAATTPSATAVATCRTEPFRTSPTAYSPFTSVSMFMSVGMVEPANDGRMPFRNAVLGSCPMQTNTPSQGSS